MKIRRAEGAAALWRGLAPTLYVCCQLTSYHHHQASCSVMALPATVSYFTLYDTLRASIDVPASISPLVSGVVARCMCFAM